MNIIIIDDDNIEGEKNKKSILKKFMTKSDQIHEFGFYEIAIMQNEIENIDYIFMDSQIGAKKYSEFMKELKIQNKYTNCKKLLYTAGGSNIANSKEDDINIDQNYIGVIDNTFTDNIYEALFGILRKGNIDFFITLQSIKEKAGIYDLTAKIYELLEPFAATYVLMQGFLILAGEDGIKNEFHDKIKNDLKKLNIDKKNLESKQYLTWGWWAECIGQSLNIEDDKNHCLFHQNGNKNVFNTEYDNSINTLNEKLTNEEAKKLIEKTLKQNINQSNLQKFCEWIFKHKKQIEKHSNERIGVEKGTQNNEILKFVELVQNALQEYEDVYEAL